MLACSLISCVWTGIGIPRIGFPNTDRRQTGQNSGGCRSQCNCASRDSGDPSSTHTCKRTALSEDHQPFLCWIQQPARCYCHRSLAKLLLRLPVNRVRQGSHVADVAMMGQGRLGPPAGFAEAHIRPCSQVVALQLPRSASALNHIRLQAVLSMSSSPSHPQVTLLTGFISLQISNLLRSICWFWQRVQCPAAIRCEQQWLAYAPLSLKSMWCLGWS